MLKSIIFFLLLFSLSYLITINIFKHDNKLEKLLVFIIILIIILYINVLLLVSNLIHFFINLNHSYLTIDPIILLLFIENSLLLIMKKHDIYDHIKKIKLKSLINFPKILFHSPIIIFILIYYRLTFIHKIYSSPLIWFYNYLPQIIIDNGHVPSNILLYGNTAPFLGEYIGYCLIFIPFKLIFNDVFFLKIMPLILNFLLYIYIYSYFKEFLPDIYSIYIALNIVISKLFIFKLSMLKTESFSILLLFISNWLIIKIFDNKNKKFIILFILITSIWVTTNVANIFSGVALIISYFIINKFNINKNNDTLLFIKIGLYSIISSTLFFLISTNRIPIIDNFLINKNTIYQSDITWNFLSFLRYKKINATISIIDYIPSYMHSDIIDYIYLLTSLFIISITLFFYSKKKNKLILQIFLYAILIVIITNYFFYSYDNFIPKATGYRRIFPYLYIVINSLPTLIIYMLPKMRLSLNGFGNSSKFIVFKKNHKIILLNIILLIHLYVNYPFIQLNHNVNISDDAYESMIWLKENTNKNTTKIILNEWASGAALGISDRNFINDGDAPYLRKKAIIPAINILNNTINFFKNPQKNIDFIEENNITHLVVTDNYEFSSFLLIDRSNIMEEELYSIGFKKVKKFNKIEIYEKNELNYLSNSTNILEMDAKYGISKNSPGRYDIDYNTIYLNEELCYNISIKEGNFSRIGLKYILYNYVDDMSYIMFDYYGRNSDENIIIVFYLPNSRNYYRYKIKDKIEGWSTLTLPFIEFEEFNNPIQDNIAKIFIIIEPTKLGNIKIKNIRLVE